MKLKLFVGLVLALLSSAVVAQAPAFDAAAGINNFNKVSPESWTHVTGSGANRVLYVGAAIARNGNASNNFACTYDPGGPNQIILTELAQCGGGSANGRLLSIFRGIAPAAGSHTITCSYDVGTSSTIMTSITMTNVNQTTPNDTPVLQASWSQANSRSIDVPSEVGDTVMDFLNTGVGETVNATAGQTVRRSEVGASNDTAKRGEKAGAAGNVTMSYGWTTNARHSLCAINVNAAAAGGSPIPVLIHHLLEIE
jgi:hypothetical protein